jgi:hypothetical protein
MVQLRRALLGCALVAALGGCPSVNLPSEPPADSGNAEILFRVLVIDFDPILESRGNQPLHQYARWNDPRILAECFCSSFAEATGGHVRHEIVDWIDLDEWPARADGFRYGDDEWLAIYEHEPRKWPEKDLCPIFPWNFLDYRSVLDRFNVGERVKRGEINQVWIFGYHYMGGVFFESRMAGRGAYWCNGPVVGSYDCDPFLVYYFNYEREVGCMLEDVGHAVESIMTHAFGRWMCWLPQCFLNKWERFTLYDKLAPGQAACGNVHFAPNSESDYDWGNPRLVQTTYVDWLHYPSLTGETVSANCQAWGNGDMAAHHRWWFNLIPRVSGRDEHGMLNDWWQYYLRPTRI